LAASVANLFRSVSTANVLHMTLENMETQEPYWFLPHRGCCLNCRIHPGTTERMLLCPTPPPGLHPTYKPWINKDKCRHRLF